MVQQTEIHDSITKELKEIVGEEWVSDFPEELHAYSYDMTEHPPSMPDYVVMPQTPEEIQKIIKLANEHKIPVVPFVTGNNVGGLTIPLKGGIVVDLKRMDRIIRLDEDDMYLIIEPGVTFGHVKRFLENTGFRYCYPNAPPFASVMANALLGGLNNLSLKHGNMSHVINGIEAVLPTGELIRIGSCALWDEHWWSLGSLPDLLGLFINWQGMSGIVTKMAIQVWPKKPINHILVVLSYDLASTYDFVRKVTHYEILDDLLLMSMETIKMVNGVPYGKAVHLEGEPRWALVLDVSANIELEYKAKYKMIHDSFKELKKADPNALFTTAEVAEKLYGRRMGDFQRLPFAIGGMLEYGGNTWVGTYMTTKPEAVVKGVEKAFEIIRKYDFESCLYTRSMSGHHYFAFRFLLRFSKEKGESERMQKCNKELLDTLLEQGAFPYKTPAWASETIIKRVNENWYELFKKVKKTIDPNGIMNPGRWGLK
ncbi:MAG: FAD-binding oxidoreductase [Candidatus Helarchaeota archaeon]